MLNRRSMNELYKNGSTYSIFQLARARARAWLLLATKELPLTHIVKQVTLDAAVECGRAGGRSAVCNFHSQRCDVYILVDNDRYE